MIALGENQFNLSARTYTQRAIYSKRMKHCAGVFVYTCIHIVKKARAESNSRLIILNLAESFPLYIILVLFSSSLPYLSPR